MRAGEVINSYHVVTEPTNSGGGMCMWAFAIKNRREYFLKEFLQPKWPPRIRWAVQPGRSGDGPTVTSSSVATRRLCIAWPTPP